MRHHDDLQVRRTPQLRLSDYLATIRCQTRRHYCSVGFIQQITIYIRFELRKQLKHEFEQDANNSTSEVNVDKEKIEDFHFQRPMMEEDYSHLHLVWRGVIYFLKYIQVHGRCLYSIFFGANTEPMVIFDSRCGNTTHCTAMDFPANWGITLPTLHIKQARPRRACRHFTLKRPLIRYHSSAEGDLAVDPTTP